MSLFQQCRRGCRHYPSFGRRVERIFWLFFEFVNILCQFLGVSADAPLLFKGFVLRSYLEFGNPWISILRFALLSDPCDGSFFSQNFTRRIVVFENLNVWFDPNFPFSRRIDFLWVLSWDTQPNWIVSINKATDAFAPPFFDFLLGCPRASVCSKLLLSLFLHPDSDLWFKHTGVCHITHDESVHVLVRTFLHGLLPLNPEELSPLRLPYL